MRLRPVDQDAPSVDEGDVACPDVVVDEAVADGIEGRLRPHEVVDRPIQPLFGAHVEVEKPLRIVGDCRPPSLGRNRERWEHLRHRMVRDQFKRGECRVDVRRIWRRPQGNRQVRQHLDDEKTIVMPSQELGMEGTAQCREHINLTADGPSVKALGRLHESRGPVLELDSPATRPGVAAIASRPAPRLLHRGCTHPGDRELLHPPTVRETGRGTFAEARYARPQPSGPGTRPRPG